MGKSCLIKRYCEQKFVPRYIATIGVDFGVRSVNVDDGTGSSQEVKVNFWDLSGDPDFVEVRTEFAADTQVSIVLFMRLQRIISLPHSVLVYLSRLPSISYSCIWFQTIVFIFSYLQCIGSTLGI